MEVAVCFWALKETVNRTTEHTYDGSLWEVWLSSFKPLPLDLMLFLLIVTHVLGTHTLSHTRVLPHIQLQVDHAKV